MFRIRFIGASSEGFNRNFYVDDTAESGNLKIVTDNEDGDSKYGVEATYSNPESPYVHRVLGMTAVEATDTVFDDALAERFIEDGYEAMFHQAVKEEAR